MIHKEQTETGRSMVEMLGVLAIIGVISIGAIAGYNYGMNRYRTNEILDGGNKRAYTVATQLSMGLQPNLSEFKDFDETAGGTFGNTAESLKQWDGEFGISISGVTKPVCENLIRMIGDNTPLRALSKGEGNTETELSAGDCADGNNDFYLVYNIGGVGSSSGSMSTSSSVSSSTSGGNSSSSGATGYCAANPDNCSNISCEDVACGTNNEEMAYDNAEDYCANNGGTLMSISDLGCTTQGETCANAPNEGSYWVTGNITDLNYSSTEELLEAFGYYTYSDLSQGFAFVITDGYLDDFLIRGATIDDYTYFPLCK